MIMNSELIFTAAMQNESNKNKFTCYHQLMVYPYGVPVIVNRDVAVCSGN